MKPLAIVPTFLRQTTDLQVTEKCLQSLRETARNKCDVLVVDDCSPELDLVVGLKHACERFDADMDRHRVNSGFSASVNVGLRRCLEEGRDAVLVNNDIEFGMTPDWLKLMVGQRQPHSIKLASIVGALLVYPNNSLIQHAGIGFSLLTRSFFHRYHYGPGDLPAAQHATVCPVTGALQFIRLECLEGIGVYDEGYRMGYEDVDYNIRAWLSGRACVYQPGVRAIHYESFTRGRKTPRIEKWEDESWKHFCATHGDVNFLEFVPNYLSVAA